MQLTPLEKDKLKEIMNIGAAHAADALSTINKRTIMIDVPAVHIVPIEQVTALMPKQEGALVAKAAVTGDLTGTTLILLPVETADLLVQCIAGDGATSNLEVVQSTILTDISSTCIKSFCDTLEEVLGVSCTESDTSVLPLEKNIKIVEKHVVHAIGSSHIMVVTVQSKFSIEGTKKDGIFFFAFDETMANHILDHLQKKYPDL
jgi:chemotaxis protein CheY-P-specific phosphatase CheC